MSGSYLASLINKLCGRFSVCAWENCVPMCCCRRKTLRVHQHGKLVIGGRTRIYYWRSDKTLIFIFYSVRFALSLEYFLDIDRGNFLEIRSYIVVCSCASVESVCEHIFLQKYYARYSINTFTKRVEYKSVEEVNATMSCKQTATSSLLRSQQRWRIDSLKKRSRLCQTRPSPSNAPSRLPCLKYTKYTRYAFKYQNHKPAYEPAG